jgi:hypothetical protein
VAETKPDLSNDDILYEFPEGILRARAAMRRDLPALLASWWKRGKLACYTGDGLVAISRSYRKLLGIIIRRGIPEGEYIIERIESGAVSEAEEWHEDRNRPG